MDQPPQRGLEPGGFGELNASYSRAPDFQSFGDRYPSKKQKVNEKSQGKDGPSQLRSETPPPSRIKAAGDDAMPALFTTGHASNEPTVASPPAKQRKRRELVAPSMTTIKHLRNRTTTTTYPTTEHETNATMSPGDFNTSITFYDNDLPYNPSTESWDLYEERMPEDVGQAVIEKLNKWVYRRDSKGLTEDRKEDYGEDIAYNFPSGGTPGYARRLYDAERAREYEENMTRDKT